MPVPVRHPMEGQGSRRNAVIDCAADAPAVAHQRPAPLIKGRIACTYNLRAFTPTHEAAIPEAGRWRLGVTQTVIGCSRPIALPPVRAAVKRRQPKTKRKGNAMSDTTGKIAELNDRFRKSTLSLDPVAISPGRTFMTSGIRALGLVATVEITERVAAFDSFTEDNDPHGEHDGKEIFWKIDYYDRATFGTGRDMGSEDPSDPAKTLRVLTIMLTTGGAVRERGPDFPRRQRQEPHIRSDPCF
jgi:hypothetical protein